MDLISRAVASMRQAEALASAIFFLFSVIFFLFNTLNTWEENLTIDIASVIIFFLATALNSNQTKSCETYFSILSSTIRNFLCL